MKNSRWTLPLGCALLTAQVGAQTPQTTNQVPRTRPVGTPGTQATRPQGNATLNPQPLPPALPASTQTILELDSDRTPATVTKGNCLIKNGTLLTVTHGILPATDVLIQNGKIAAIGKNLTAPAGVVTIDATGKFVSPGLIDAHSHIALDSVNEGSDAITAEVRMHDVINPQSLSIYRGLSNGVTSSLLLHGSANPIGGQSVVVKMKYKRPVEELIVPDAPRMIKFALGENVKQSNGGGFNQGPSRFPGTRMGVEAVYRRAFAEARKYNGLWDKYNAGKSGNPNALPPRRDLRLETLADILNGKIWVQCHSYRADEMLMMVRLSQEYHFKLVFQHGLEAYKIAPEIAAAGVQVSTFADAWAYKEEAFDAIPYNAALCTRAGIVTSVNSDNTAGTYRLNIEAANSMKYGGLNENEALRLVTINPAMQLGIDKRAGSLDVGKDGDITIWDGHPLSVFSKPRMTLVEGDVFYQRKDPFGVDKQASATQVLDTHVAEPTVPLVPPVRRAYAIVGATVHPVSSADIVGGTVVIEDGKIKAVGKNVAIPSGAYVLHAKGMHVYPGLIDAGSEVGLQEIESIRATIDTSESGEFQPDLLAATAVNPGSEMLAIARGNGITSAAVRPSGGTVSGQIGIIDLAGWTPELMRVKSPVALAGELSRIAARRTVRRVPDARAASAGITARYRPRPPIARLLRACQTVRECPQSKPDRHPAGTLSRSHDAVCDGQSADHLHGFHGDGRETGDSVRGRSGPENHPFGRPGRVESGRPAGKEESALHLQHPHQQQHQRHAARQRLRPDGYPVDGPRCLAAGGRKAVV